MPCGMALAPWAERDGPAAASMLAEVSGKELEVACR